MIHVFVKMLCDIIVIASVLSNLGSNDFQLYNAPGN